MWFFFFHHFSGAESKSPSAAATCFLSFDTAAHEPYLSEIHLQHLNTIRCCYCYEEQITTSRIKPLTLKDWYTSCEMAGSDLCPETLSQANKLISFTRTDLGVSMSKDLSPMLT